MTDTGGPPPQGPKQGFVPFAGRSVFVDTGAHPEVGVPTTPGSSAPRPPEPVLPEDRPEIGSSARRVVRASPMWRWFFPLLLGLAALAAYSLFRSGYDLVLDSRDGAVESQNDDPTAPGYRAIVEPTRTMVIYETSDIAGVDELVGVQVVSLDPNGGGAVIVVPASLLTQLPDGSAFDLAAEFDPADPSDVTERIGELLGTRFTDEPTILDDDGMVSAFSPLGTVDYLLPDDLTIERADGSVEVLLEAGRHELEPEELTVVNAVLRPGEVLENRLLRQVDLWQSITGALADLNDLDTAYPPADEGFFHAVRVLAAGEVRVQQLPVALFAPPDGTPFFVVADPEAVAELTAEIVPLPLDPGDGRRVQTALLSGTGDPDILTEAIAPLVAAGAEISVTGNADLVGLQVTSVVYHRVEAAAAAAAMAEAIGADPPTYVELVDPLTSVTVTLGADFVPPGG